MKEKAVVDRFEGEIAVLIVGVDKRRMEVHRKQLPKNAKEGQWLQLEIENGVIGSVTVDEEETAKVKQRIAEKLERLRHGDQKK
jgi:hypothetical protein